MNSLLRLLNDEGNDALIVVQSNRDDNLRQFSASLVTHIFNDRKRRGANSPQILFLYDEADEFMPSQPSPGTSYGIARAAITMLARRGRKFGLGLSFATQRVAYLDTSILGQAHTYLISKLPRQYDRETVSNAFGLSEDMLKRTLKFSKGQWLLVSYEATGLENVPLPVQFPNANKRIREFLESYNSASQAPA
jgi:DNA helicase HerA-like ATPase